MATLDAIFRHSHIPHQWIQMVKLYYHLRVIQILPELAIVWHLLLGGELPTNRDCGLVDPGYK